MPSGGNTSRDIRCNATQAPSETAMTNTMTVIGRRKDGVVRFTWRPIASVILQRRSSARQAGAGGRNPKSYGRSPNPVMGVYGNDGPHLSLLFSTRAQAEFIKPVGTTSTSSVKSNEEF